MSGLARPALAPGIAQGGDIDRPDLRVTAAGLGGTAELGKSRVDLACLGKHAAEGKTGIGPRGMARHDGFKLPSRLGHLPGPRQSHSLRDGAGGLVRPLLSCRVGQMS